MQHRVKSSSDRTFEGWRRESPNTESALTMEWFWKAFCTSCSGMQPRRILLLNTFSVCFLFLLFVQWISSKTIRSRTFRKKQLLIIMLKRHETCQTATRFEIKREGNQELKKPLTATITAELSSFRQERSQLRLLMHGRDELKSNNKMNGCYSGNKSDTNRTTQPTSLVVSTLIRKISPSVPIERAMRTTRKGHSLRKAQSEVLPCGQIQTCSSQWPKSKNQKWRKLLGYSTVLYVKTMSVTWRQMRKGIHQSTSLQQVSYPNQQIQNSEGSQKKAWEFSMDIFKQHWSCKKLKFWKWMKSLSVTIRANVHFFIFD